VSAKILQLIDKQDTFEIVRDEIAAILYIEKENQKELASTAGKDPALWDFDVYLEASNPWEIIEDPINGEIISETPLINIFYDQTTFDDSSSNFIEQQSADAIYSIDCLAAKNHLYDKTNTIQRGDKLSSLDCQRVVRLVRNIIMAAEYSYLQHQGLISLRSFQSIGMFQPNINDHPAQNVIGCRMNLAVNFLEFSPQTEPVTIELISFRCERDSDGKIHFNYTFE
jgi:hypothetical protein